MSDEPVESFSPYGLLCKNKIKQMFIKQKEFLFFFLYPEQYIITTIRARHATYFEHVETTIRSGESINRQLYVYTSAAYIHLRRLIIIQYIYMKLVEIREVIPRSRIRVYRYTICPGGPTHQRQKAAHSVLILLLLSSASNNYSWYDRVGMRLWRRFRSYCINTRVTSHDEQYDFSFLLSVTSYRRVWWSVYIYQLKV